MDFDLPVRGLAPLQPLLALALLYLLFLVALRLLLLPTLSSIGRRGTLGRRLRRAFLLALRLGIVGLALLALYYGLGFSGWGEELGEAAVALAAPLLTMPGLLLTIPLLLIFLFLILVRLLRPAFSRLRR